MYNAQSLAEYAKKFTVGQHGYLKLTRIMCDIEEDGNVSPVTDLATTNDAKATFAKSSDTYGTSEKRVMGMLKDGHHTSPFRGTVLQIEVCAPLMIARQWYKYAVGSDHDETMALRDPVFAWNEVSRRYVTRTPEMFTPGVDGWRAAPETRRQGSAGPLDSGKAENWQSELEAYQSHGATLYQQAIADGVAAEQARLFLPAYALMVTWRWTFSLQAGCHVVKERDASDAQAEWQPYAAHLQHILRGLFPDAAGALLEAATP